MKATKLALALGFIASCGLSSVASAVPNSNLTRCSDPSMVMSPACDRIMKRAGISMSDRREWHDAGAINCNHKLERIQTAAATLETGSTRTTITDI